MKQAVEDALQRHRLTEAFGHLEAMTQAMHSPWEVAEELRSLQSQYTYMMKYALDGVADPSRGAVYADISKGVLNLANTLMRQCAKPTAPTLYFNTLRYEELQRGDTIGRLIESYLKTLDRLNMATMTGIEASNEQQADQMEQELEARATRAFHRTWVSHPLTSDDVYALRQLIMSPVAGRPVRQQMLSAVMLGALEYYDERRLLLLADIYADKNSDLRMVALAALLLAMWMNRTVLGGSRLSSRLKALADDPQWEKDVRMVFMQYIRTRDTERINRKMHDELIPEMLKLRPEISRRLQELQERDPQLIDEENPEWQELMEESGLADKMKQLTELQADGGDVMMGAFAHLKTFPFFSEVANWFLPFFPQHSEVKKAMGQFADELGSLIENCGVLCHSDRYSMALSMSNVSEAQSRLMMEQLRAQNVNIAELQQSLLLQDERMREYEVNHYVQDLYRFFKLFRRKGEFADPFLSPINLIELPLIGDALIDSELLKLVGEFYFKRQYYNDALSIYQLMLRRGDNAPELYQKAGFCLQKGGELDEALKMYEKAHLLRPDSQWTLKRLAYCHRLMGNHAEAARYYRQLAEAAPEDINTALNLGYCLMAQGLHDEALKQYFKVEYLDQKSQKAVRPIAWCLFLQGDLERAEAYYSKLAPDQLTATDALNQGHLRLAQGHVRQAVDSYKRSIQLTPIDSYQHFTDQMKADRDVLLQRGVDPLLIDLVIDATLNQ